ncbi:MAG TPA: response regulator [Sphingomicrobium sp.]|nr:response regulator [Sphingomicrobium sp.]
MTADLQDGKSEPAIYVVDDDPAVARTVARIGRSIGLDAQTFDSAAALLDALDQLGHGCVVLDIQMPGTSGIELLRILAERRPTWPVIMLTAYAEVGSAIDAFRGGAIHFLRKPFTRKQLVDALNEAAEVASDRMRRAVEPGQLAALKQLTPRERQVLDALADGQQSKAIAWRLGISTRTVELHRSNILSKLSARNTSQAVAIARSASFDRKPH